MFVADYVLMEYGTGAIMAVPAHDERDFEFAAEARTGDPARGRGCDELPYPGDGPMVNSGRFDGMHNREAFDQIIEEAKGEPAINYRLRDWLLSRQRYWGCPIPIVHCPECGLVPVPDDQLPVELPDVEDYAPKGRSPLAAAEDWVNTACPSCGGDAKRETDTMDTFVDSSWYFLRYCDAHNEEAPWDREVVEALDARRPVHRRRGARDPAPDVRALLRARRWRTWSCSTPRSPSPACSPRGWSPATARRCPSRRATRSRPTRSSSATGPTPRAARSSTSATRRRAATGPTRGSTGLFRFLSRLWRAADEAPDGPSEPEGEPGSLVRKAHWAIDKVTRDLGDRFATHTSIAAVIELVNEIYRERESADPSHLRFAIATAASLVFPFAPHLGSEVYESMTGRRVWEEPWPKADPELLTADVVQLVVQLNGKLVDRLEMPADASEEVQEQIARGSEKLAGRLNGKEIVKTIVVPKKLVNFVAR